MKGPVNDAIEVLPENTILNSSYTEKNTLLISPQVQVTAVSGFIEQVVV